MSAGPTKPAPEVDTKPVGSILRMAKKPGFHCSPTCTPPKLADETPTYEIRLDGLDALDAEDVAFTLKPRRAVAVRPLPKSSEAAKNNSSVPLFCGPTPLVVDLTLPEVVVEIEYIPASIKPPIVTSAKVTPKDNKDATATRVF